MKAVPMSDVQPMLWLDDIEAAIGWYRDRLGCEITVFGHDADGRASVCLAALDGAALLITRDPAMSLDGSGKGSGHVRLYFHLGQSVTALHERVAGEADVEVVQEPTDQWWGDRTLILRDPWGTVLVLSNATA
jgi:PhnB protein